MLLERKQLSLMVGAPGSGRSFLALDLALSASNRKPWLGHDVAPGDVVLAHADPASSVWRRLDAYAKAGVRTNGRVHTLEARDPQRVVDHLYGMRERLALVILDLGAGDVAPALDAASQIRDMSGAHVMVVTQLMLDRPGGHSAPVGIVDVVVGVGLPDENGDRHVRVIKDRAGGPHVDQRFKIGVVKLDGDVLTGMVIHVPTYKTAK